MIFPPPPPAPPQAYQNHPISNHPVTFNGFQGRGDGGYRGRVGQPRHNHLNLSRGGHSRPVGDMGGFGGHVAGNHTQFNPQDTGYQGHPHTSNGEGYASASYQPLPQPQYPPDLRNTHKYGSSGSQSSTSDLQTPRGFPQPVRSGFYDQNGQLHQTSHGYRPSTSSGAFDSQNGPSPGNWDSGSAAHTAQPIMQGPPIRIGYDLQRGGLHSQVYQSDQIQQNLAQTGGYGSPYGQNGPSNFQKAHHNSPKPFSQSRGRGRKRGHGEAFGRARHQGSPRGQAPPAVPRFGGPLQLPAKPPAPQGPTKRPRKKKRKHNQLGLTPKAEEHESSEEEDYDGDEESKLAATVSGAGQLQQLQITHKGRTSTLSSSSDIAAWIEERKKRFPTKARAAEAATRKRQRDEALKAVRDAQKEQREKQNAEAREKKQEADAESERRKVGVTVAKAGSEDRATKAKRKVEKLRRQLEREEKRIARAEAKTSRDEGVHAVEEDVGKAASGRDVESKKRKRSSSPEPMTVSTLNGAQDATNAPTIKISLFQDAPESMNPVPDPLTPTSQPPPPDEGQNTPLPQSNIADPVAPPPAALTVTRDRTLMSDLSSVPSTDSEDLTSSSGSSGSSTDSDDAPEEATTKRERPDRIPPPKREKTKQLCRKFMETGRCRFGDSCRFRHELPARGSQAAKEAKRSEAKRPEGKGERVSLHQRLVEQEERNEDEAVLGAIIDLGDKGFLDQAAEEQSDTADAAEKGVFCALR